MRYLALPILLALGACATPGGGFLSPGTAGAPASSAALAQSVSGTQGSAGGTATSGTASATVLNQFAAKVDAETLDIVRQMALDGGWSPADTKDFLSALVDAPETVTISGNQTITNHSGDADTAGMGAGGGSVGAGGVVPNRP